MGGGGGGGQGANANLWNGGGGGESDPSTPPLQVSEIQGMWCRGGVGWGMGSRGQGVRVPQHQIEQHFSCTFRVMFIFMYYEANKIWMRQKKGGSCIARV